MDGFLLYIYTYHDYLYNSRSNNKTVLETVCFTFCRDYGVYCAVRYKVISSCTSVYSEGLLISIKHKLFTISQKLFLQTLLLKSNIGIMSTSGMVLMCFSDI